MAEQLIVNNLVKYYPIKGGIIPHTVAEIKAVDGVSFSIEEGTTLGLVGESGCGKSTIGRQIVALEKPTSGSIFFEGEDITVMPESRLQEKRTNLQMVFQDPYSSLNPRKKVFHILADPMIHHHICTREEAPAKVNELLDMVGLNRSAKDRFPHEFSGGQRQRIGIARALALNPRLIVLDEPVSALDVSIQAQILNLLKSLQKELNLTCLFVGHGLGAVNYVSDRIAVMYLGKIVELGEAKDVLLRPVHPYTNALIQAAPVPDPEMEEKEHQILQGEIGSSVNPPSGCRFHPRCPFATEKCRTEEPVLKICASAESAGMKGHQVACHYADQMIMNGKAGSV